MRRIFAYFSRIKSLAKLCLFCTIMVAMSGCFHKDEIIHKPSPLPALKARNDTVVKFSTLWKHRVGNGKGNLWLNLHPVISQDIIYAASYSGVVTAIQKDTGKKIWRTELPKTNITGGVGIGGDLLVLGTVSGDVVALDIKTGKKQWSVYVDGEVVSTPAVKNSTVVIQTTNGKIAAFSSTGGKQLWRQAITPPAVSLRGSASPVIYNNSVITGLASGDVMAWDLRSGSLLWQNTVTVPGGSPEVANMVDIDATPLIDHETVYAISYQGNIKAIDASGGHTLWSRKASSYYDMISSTNHLYFTDVKSHLVAMDKTDGHVVWSQDKLAYRYLSAPAMYGEYIFVGDNKGYMHVISANNGEITARYQPDSAGISSQPLVDGDCVYIYTNKGDLIALNLTETMEETREAGQNGDKNCKLCKCIHKNGWVAKTNCIAQLPLKEDDPLELDNL